RLNVIKNVRRGLIALVRFLLKHPINDGRNRWRNVVYYFTQRDVTITNLRFENLTNARSLEQRVPRQHSIPACTESIQVCPMIYRLALSLLRGDIVRRSENTRLHIR